MRHWFFLGLGITLLHLTALQWVTLRLHMDQNVQNMAFVTRTIALASPAADIPSTQQPKPKPRAVALASPSKAKTAPTPARQTAAPPAPHVVVPDHTPSAADHPTEITHPAANQVVFTTEGLPVSVKLNYKVDSNKFPYTLQGELLWQHNNNSYRARLSFGALGFTRTQTSRGRIGHEGLMPERFSDKFRSEVAAHFNYERQWVTFSANTPDVKLQTGAQDRLSVLVQLAALMSGAAQPFKPGTTLSVQTIGPRAADLWLFTFGDIEELHLPSGNLQGLKLVRNPDQPYDQKVEIWLAPSLNYLPARIRLTETNGDFIDQQWVSSEAAPSSGDL
jgi:hypothetical protein